MIAVGESVVGGGRGRQQRSRYGRGLVAEWRWSKVWLVGSGLRLRPCLMLVLVPSPQPSTSPATRLKTRPCRNTSFDFHPPFLQHRPLTRINMPLR